MEVKFSALSEIGNVRSHNEDYYGIDENTPNGRVYVVCDGMGGHVGGATASRLAVNSILEYFQKEKYDNIILEIDKAFQFANEQIFAHTLSQPELKGMGTTAVVLIIKKEDCYIGHVGDSRIYIKSEKKLHRLTKDHSYVQGLVDAGLISDDEAEKHPQKNQILKALGHTSDVKPSVCKKPFRVKAGDTFLLCSDGLNGMINDVVIESMIQENDLEKSKNDLFEAAMANGGLDNVTILLLTVTQSKYYGKNDFKSFNPIERGKGQEDSFDKTSGFSKTQQFEINPTVNQKKKKWIPQIVIGSVSIFVITISLFFVFGNKEQALSQIELKEKSFKELIALAKDSVFLSADISEKENWKTSDGRLVHLIVSDNKLIGVIEDNKTSNTPPVKSETGAETEIEPEPETETKKETETEETKVIVKSNNVTSVKTNPKGKNTNGCLTGNKAKQLKFISDKRYYIEAGRGGETLKAIISRIKGDPEYGCIIPKIYEDPEKLADLNKSNNPKIPLDLKAKLKDDNIIIPVKTMIIIECECNQ